MASKTTRRASVIAGLALLPALVFGGAASAAATDGGPTGNPPSQSQTKDRSDEVRVAMHGKITNIEKRGDVKWGEVLVYSIAGAPGERPHEFIVTPATVLEGGIPHVNDFVEATGIVQPNGAVVAENITIR